MDGHRVVLGTYFLVILYITADEVYVKHEAPMPSRYIGASIAWLIFGVLSNIEPGVGGGLAILATVGMFLTNAKLFSALPGSQPVGGGKKK